MNLEDKLEDAMEVDDRSKSETYRGISYEDDDSDELRDNEAAREANERRQNVTQKAVRKIQRWWRHQATQTAVRKIQRWWRNISAIRAQKRIEEHVRKYASDLICIPCGKRCETKERLHKHVLQDENHDSSASQYEKFMSDKPIIGHWVRQAEELLDQKELGKIVFEHDMAEKLTESIGLVSFSLNFIERRCRWTDRKDLQENIDALQKAFWEVKAQVIQLDGMFGE